MKTNEIVTYLKNAATEFENREELIAFAYGYIFGCLHNSKDAETDARIWKAYGEFLDTYVNVTPRFNVVVYDEAEEIRATYGDDFRG